MQFITNYATTRGNFHDTNQDCIGIFEAEYAGKRMILGFICDGMGGEAAGEKASKLCLEMLQEWFVSELVKFAPLFKIEEMKAGFDKCIRQMNTKLCAYRRKSNLRLGSTLSVIFINPYKDYLICHVGDSRIYQVRRNICQLTKDHKIRGKNKMNEIMECVGITEEINVFYTYGKTKPNDFYILCSDGLYNRNTQNEINREIKDIVKLFKKNKKRYGPDVKIKEKIMNDIIKKLIKRALRRGETDNISIAIINCGKE